ncbi:MAG TPA: hypothetical protein VFJ66_08725 [Gaiellales bacterium]|nr:hypothetical protein [Gaiellales bacterium]
MLRRTLLVAVSVLAVFAPSAGATTVTRHQNPHYRVTASLLPTNVTVGGRLKVSLTVTNTTSRVRTLSIDWEYDGPSSSEGGGIAGIRLAAHASWTKTFSRTAADAGGYKAVVRATDRAGTSHAAATATAS